MSPAAGSPTLVLVPTALELRGIEACGGFEPGTALVHVCGFGPIAAAARAAELCERLRPARVLLVGIAGTFDPERLCVGSAAAFDAVAIAGVGAGEGERWIGPEALGFPQWPGVHDADRASSSIPGPRARPDSAASPAAAPIGDRLALARSPYAVEAGGRASHATENLLLTVCAASDSPAHAARWRARFPDALAEDMEGFGVALACALAGVPLSIVRGASNVAGDRDSSRWRIAAALGAARTCALEVLRHAASPT